MSEAKRYTDDDGYICVRDGVYLTRYWQNGEVKDVTVIKDEPADAPVVVSAT